jgi:hypothetical protein
VEDIVEHDVNNHSRIQVEDIVEHDVDNHSRIQVEDIVEHDVDNNQDNTDTCNMNIV